MKLTKQQRAELKQKYGGKCAYCGCELGERWHADHIEPIQRDFKFVNGKTVMTGTSSNPEHDNYENLNPSCQPCNNNKHSYSLEGWRKQLEKYQETLLRDSSTARHLNRFGLLEIKKQPVVFYFEQLEQKP